MQLLKIYIKNMVGASRFERPTSCSQGRRANQAALRPDVLLSTFIGSISFIWFVYPKTISIKITIH